LYRRVHWQFHKFEVCIGWWSWQHIFIIIVLSMQSTCGNHFICMVLIYTSRILLMPVLSKHQVSHYYCWKKYKRKWQLLQVIPSSMHLTLGYYTDCYYMLRTSTQALTCVTRLHSIPTGLANGWNYAWQAIKASAKYMEYSWYIP